MFPFVSNELESDMNIISMPLFTRIQMNPFTDGIIQLLFSEDLKDFFFFFLILMKIYSLAALDILY